MTIKCEGCGRENPDEAKFCLECGNPVNPAVAAPKPSDNDLDPNGFGMLCFGLSFMFFFFSIVPAFFGLWWLTVLLIGVGITLLILRVLIIRTHRAEWEARMKKAEERLQAMRAKVKCRYCGSLNDQTARKCDTCGATL